MQQRRWITLLVFTLATVALANPTGIVVQDADSISTIPTNGNLPALAINPRIILESASDKEEVRLQPLPVSLGAAARHVIIGATTNETHLLTFPEGLPGDLPSYVYFSVSYLPFVKR